MLYKCKYCNKEFDNFSSLGGHTSHCEKNYNKKNRTHEDYSLAAKKGWIILSKLKDEYRKLHPYEYEIKEFYCECLKCKKKYVINITQKQFDKGKYIKHCSKSCANSRILTDEIKEKISKSIKTSEKYKANVVRPFKTYYCKWCKKPFTMKDIRNVGGRTYCSRNCKHEFLSLHTGGYRIGASKGIKGWYKGIYCDSSWELAFLVYYLDHNMNIKRCKEGRKYIFKGKEHIYYPDFITDDGIIEIKGRITKNWEAKIELNPDIKVLYGEDMKIYIKYASEKYGNKFWDVLYEK